MDQDHQGDDSAASRRHRPSGRDENPRPERQRWRPWLPGFLSWESSDDESDPPAVTEIQIRELQREVHDAHTRICLLEGEAQDARNAAQEAWDRLRVEEDANRRLLKAARSIETERDTMSANIQKQEAQIRQVQTIAFGGIGGDSWAAGDDGTVRADLESLHARIKSWAKKHAVDSMCDAVKGLGPDEHAAFIQLLGEVVRIRPGAENPIEHLEAGAMNKRSPAMCLQGLLAHHVYAEIISRPFFALGDAGEEVMSKVYGSIHQVNESEAHLWRAKTLRLLSTNLPPPDDSTPAPPPPKSTYLASQQTTCNALTLAFLTSPAIHLIKPPSPASTTTTTPSPSPLPADLDLSPLLQHAGALSTRLWSRKTVLRTQGLAQLRHKRFAARSELLRAHPLHRLYDDDERCDGWSVGVVTHPAVWGFGSGDGREYGVGTGRVWVRGEVWLVEDAS